MIHRASRRSGKLFSSGFYCAESVLLAIAESKGINSELIPKIATGFCSGMSRTCGLCGAVAGAIMGLNLVTGRTSPNHDIEKNYTAVRRLTELFEEQFGSTNCKQLTGCDLGTQEGQEIFKANKLRDQCKKYTEEATRIAMLLIDEQT